MHLTTKWIIRPLRVEEYGLLKAFCYEALFVPPGCPTPPREVVDLPAMRVYYEAFGADASDLALGAETPDKRIVGVIWSRCRGGYGHWAEGIPELALAVRASHRGRGIGTALLQALLEKLGKCGYAGVSLSVQKANFAHHMYLKAGFRIVRKTDGESTMLYKF